jgi:hypothetical protein
MKKLSTLFVLMTAFLMAGAQTQVVQEDVLLIKNTVHDFGKIPQGKPVYYTFEIVNNGKTDLILDNVQAARNGVKIPLHPALLQRSKWDIMQQLRIISKSQLRSLTTVINPNN